MLIRKLCKKRKYCNESLQNTKVLRSKKELAKKKKESNEQNLTSIEPRATSIKSQTLSKKYRGTTKSKEQKVTINEQKVSLQMFLNNFIMSWPKVFLVETFKKNGSPIIADIRVRIKG